jgi:hypothetical protein
VIEEHFEPVEIATGRRWFDGGENKRGELKKNDGQANKQSSDIHGLVGHFVFENQSCVSN